MSSVDGEIRIKATLDSKEAESGLEGLNDQMQETADGAGSLGEKLKNGLVAAAKAGVAAVGMAVAGVSSLAKSALDSYASYEQLVGGVDTLFKESSKTVQEYAANAYKTAGMSANEYMETVTSFSASLLQSLDGDTEKAAETANQALVDMSDNANKMGTSMESIQNAYQGFAKQNYTMLDNLKLGYGGTKEEMERLIADANAVKEANGEMADLSIDSFADVTEAIHIIQTEMGITGTTAKEAGATIEGSVGSMKAAWANLVTGIADDNADLDLLIDNFVNSVSAAGSNILPRIETILSGIGDLIVKMAPMISAQLPVIIEQVMPSLLEAGTSLLTGLISGVVAAAPYLVDAAVSTLTTLATYLIENLPLLVDSAGQIVTTLVTSIEDAFPKILDAGQKLLDQLVSGIETGLPDMISRLPQVINSFLNFITAKLPSILDMGVKALKSLTDGIVKAIPQLVAALPQVISSFIGFIAQNGPKIIQSGIEVLLNLVTGIINTIPKLVAQTPQIIMNFVSTIASNLPKIVQAGKDILLQLVSGIIKNVGTVVSNIPKVVSAITDGLSKAISKVKEIGKNIVQGIWNGISAMASWIKDKVTGFFSGIVSGVKNLLGIHSPSKVFANIGEYMGEGLADGIDASSKTAEKAAGEMASAVTNAGMPRLARFGNLAPAMPSIPQIASGSVLPANSSFTSAMRGNGGIDMEAITATVNAAVAKAMEQVGSGEITVNVNSILDGKVIARNTVKHINDMTRSAGRPVLLY